MPNISFITSLFENLFWFFLLTKNIRTFQLHNRWNNMHKRETSIYSFVLLILDPLSQPASQTAFSGTEIWFQDAWHLAKASGPADQLHCCVPIAKQNSYKQNSWKTLTWREFGLGPLIHQTQGCFSHHNSILIHMLMPCINIYLQKAAVPCARREGGGGGSGCTLLGSLAVWSCPGAGALAGVAIDPIGAGPPILARVADTFINVLCTIRACPACITQAEIARDHCLQI